MGSNRDEPRVRQQLRLVGMVQGVGFRPFVHRLATACGLAGWVRNSSSGVTVEVEGPEARVKEFVRRLETDAPPHAKVYEMECVCREPEGATGFAILPSEADAATAPFVLPDLALCDACRSELFDPNDRRYRHPFITCTHCGPRYTIVAKLPYDRPNTSMARFAMCDACRSEYENPDDRRHHAQPIACSECGPRLALWTARGDEIETRDAALRAAAEALREGAIVAVKGLGGFHLMADARSSKTVGLLRERKGRWRKPFAVMVPDLETLRALCRVSCEEERVLRSAAAPIVLLDRRSPALAENVAPGLSRLGVLLPYTPLHHLLMDDLQFPLVATSGNLSEEPICIDEKDALRDLGRIADFLLVHDRPILRPVDDSVMMVASGRPMVLRRARGLAPIPISVRRTGPALLAVGAHQKCTVALGVGQSVVLSQHLGDLETEKACAAFEAAQEDLGRLYGLQAAAVACDLHPDYVSTRSARASGLPCEPVQHHHAHVVSCLAENDLQGRVLGVAWDGTGLGTDGTIWGGEFLLADEAGFERFAALRAFSLPGGDAAVREPRRVAFALLWEAGCLSRAESLGVDAVRSFASGERQVLQRLLEQGLNAPRTSSMGRLFDAVSALVGLCPTASFEGEAAMVLEAAASDDPVEAYPMTWVQGPDGWRLDWQPLVEALLDDLEQGRTAASLAARFHEALARAVLEAARRAALERVVLSGGCFQNRRLLERSQALLREGGFRVFVHQSVPPNDGGLALGQWVAAAARLARRAGA